MGERIYRYFHEPMPTSIMECIGDLPRCIHDGSLAPRTAIEREAMRSYDDDFVVRMTKYSAEIEGSKLQLHDTKLVIDGDPSDFMGIFLACLEEEASARYGMLEKCRAL